MTLRQIRETFDPKTILSSLISAGIVASFGMYAVQLRLEAEVSGIRAELEAATLRAALVMAAHKASNEESFQHTQDRIDRHIEHDQREQESFKRKLK